jgi:hypothetical protein
MYEVKFTVGGIGRLLPVATNLLVPGLSVIWTAAAHSELTPQADPQSDPPAAQVESGRKQFYDRTGKLSGFTKLAKVKALQEF